jgi:hypothetical protein
MQIAANSVEEAITILDSRDTAIDGRESYFQAHDTDENKVLQIFYDDEDGEDTIVWRGKVTGQVTPGNSKVIEFTC